ncbi:hypothetical protein [Candidatus Mycolicibacterium alkanivorans]|uniref:DUF732 domain-containing protein n=1 Tax=Candidatus Mycolicibacterium alkanivorans TaxID=2954114 RepID=A0ABS9YVB4_9MYCO|nr:hypothetical protein [Candidatus Mycolicibacterium alkanivorans]MCI4674812.1 hypothetical protein [Candidatus Mycolicibacterium alkanivorans]
MKPHKTTRFAFTALVGGALSAALIGLAAPATAAPTETSDHHSTGVIDSLGYTVVSDNTIDALQRD